MGEENSICAVFPLKRRVFEIYAGNTAMAFDQVDEMWLNLLKNRVQGLSMSTTVFLRDVIASDLPIFFEQQFDPVANQMAAFPARDREAFMAHWAKILADKSNILKAIVSGDQVAGNIVSWEQPGEGSKREVGYWLGREFWGKGIATQALSLLLEQVTTRPLYAYVAKHNLASVRVLEKCGFTITGEDKGLARTGGEGVEELILILRE